MDRTVFEKLLDRYEYLNVKVHDYPSIIRHSLGFKCDGNGIYFNYGKERFAPYKDIIFVKEFTKSQLLFSILSSYTYGFHNNKKRQEIVKKGFSYAGKHGYDVALKHYFMLIGRKNDLR